MAVTTLNVTAGSQAIVTLGNTAVMAAPGGTNGLALPTVQDVTVNAGTQSVRYSTLDSSASSAFTTVNENEITMNLLVDEDAFFGNSSLSTNPVAQLGLLTTSINKTEIEFSVAFSGSAAGNFYISGKGFIAGLSPTASVDQAIWQTPCQIIVNGELTKGTTS
jgi:hypothetical protein|tara:strand:+ start:1436 stop:1924 length:489 start_codon:yes stop_codon:yes gene_type:complete